MSEKTEIDLLGLQCAPDADGNIADDEPEYSSYEPSLEEPKLPEEEVDDKFGQSGKG